MAAVRGRAMLELERDYPDVLSVLATRGRLEMKTVQCALGTFPARVAVGQPVEVLALLQSTINEPQRVRLTFSLPRRDSSGRRLSFFLPRKEIDLTLGPGEVGLLHLPVTVQPPTPPARRYPVMLHVQARPHTRVLTTPVRVRSPGIGRPPSFLSVSRIRLDVLRDVPYCGGVAGQPGYLRAFFDIMSGHVKPGLVKPTLKYEVLWTMADLQREQERIAEVYERAEAMAFDFTRGETFTALEEATRARFERAGLPLDPAEARFISKSLVYIFEEAFEVEKDVTLADARWFQRLCCLLALDESVLEQDKGALAAGPLYEGALYDAVCITLPMVQMAARQRYTDREAHREYAETVVRALQGGLPMELQYAYWPLLLGGALLHARLLLRFENPWESLELLEAAGRERYDALRDRPDMLPIFHMLDRLIGEAREILRRGRIGRDGF